MFIFSHLANGGGKFCPSHYFAQSRVRRRANLSVDPAPPLMTRADSIADGLIVDVPTADGDWDGTTTYDLNGNPIEGVGVGGVDTELDSPWGE